MKKINRIYHPYNLWEEINHNMWGDVENKQSMLMRAIKFTGDHKNYGRFMRKVIKQWKYSCENALTDEFINRKAWLGHAACEVRMNCPEDITHQAWKYLSH